MLFSLWLQDLKQELKNLGLSQAGKKDELSKRLELAMEAAASQKPNPAAEGPLTKVTKFADLF